ncbi:MAG: aminotransferase class I/II-fold pyridoxal phosphate-dependent enzyme, partial [Brachybacterium tyrofermentans]
MYTDLKDQLTAELAEIEQAGTFKHERVISTPQSNRITAGPLGRDGAEVLNFCANNYLGLADHPDLLAAAKKALDERGFGMASVRFICGTQDLHLELERAVSTFLGTEETILFSSCFDANGAVFEPLFGTQDAIISDALNHASLIDGIRLSKAARYRYRNADLEDLRTQLDATRDQNDGAGARRTIIVTDGVFSMDGYLAPLDGICDLADEYGALVLVDDSHAVGFMGATGAGTP